MNGNNSQKSNDIKDFPRKVVLFYNSKLFLWCLIGLGVILRLNQYLFNRSLWVDEAFLVLNIINRPFSGLLKPLDYSQGAPLGFLMTQKFLTQIFGSSEYVLRLFPLLCGIIALFLFYKVAAHYLKAKTVPIALALFAISNKLIYYSAEAKQYSTDVAMALLLFLVTIYIQPKKLTPSRIALFGIIGTLAICFSHPAVFVLAGIGLSLTLFSYKRKEWSRIGRLFIVFLIWISSFAASYLISLAHLTHHKGLLYFWTCSFMPFPPANLSDLNWFVRVFFGIFVNPVSFTLCGIAAFTFLAGCFSMLLEKKKDFFILISPLPFLFLASGLHKYPIEPKLILFIVPFVLLLIAQGAGFLIAKIFPKSAFLGVIFVVLLFIHPVTSAMYSFMRPWTVEEIKTVLKDLREHWQDGDVLYLYYGSQYAFRYYAEDYDFKPGSYIIGVRSKDDWNKYVKDLHKLRGNKRVWVLFSRICRDEGVDEEKFFLFNLDNMGTRLLSINAPGASAYLYDLSNEATEQGSKKNSFIE